MTAIMFLGVSVSVVFVTTMLVLFLLYWKEPEVRASSRALSLCIFLGCYLLLAGSLGNSEIGRTAKEPGTPICTIIVNICFPGIDLILATVLAKTLRIFYIFTKHKKTGKACSDIALLAMIAPIVLGKVIILVLWNFIDLFYFAELLELATDGDGLLYYKVSQKCYSRQTVAWLFAITAYSFAIMVPLLVFAYRTRKIKQEDYRCFKDTKKISAFTALVIIIFAVCVPLWIVLQIVGMSNVYVATVGYTAVVIVCQLFLIIPKIGPSLKKSCVMYFSFKNTGTLNQLQYTVKSSM